MRLIRALGVFGAAIVVATLLPAPAMGATDARVQPLTLQSQTPWVGKGGTFEVRLAAPPPQSASPSDLEFAISVHPASSSRSAFTQTLTARPNTSPLAVVTTLATETVTDSTGAVTLNVDIQDPSRPRDRTRVGLRGAGVYPVAVELRTIGGAVHARLLTHLVFVPEAPTGPKLAVGIVVPVRAPIALRADGTDRLKTIDASAIAGVANALATLPSAGVMLNPSPETLAALSRGTRAVDTAALSGLRALGRNHNVIDAPFVSTQSPESTTTDRSVSLQRGREITGEVFGTVPQSRVSLIDDPSDDRLDGGVAAQRVIVADRLLQPAAQRVTNAEPVLVRRPTSRSTTPALIADAGLSAHLTNTASPVLSAYHLLADLATIYFDNPGRFRSVVVNPPSSWRAEATVLAPLLAGLASSPILAGESVDRLFASESLKTTPRTRVYATPPTPPMSPPGFATVRRTITSLASVTAESPDVARSFTDRMLIAESSSFGTAERRAYVHGLTRALSNERHKFLLPTGGSLTLTARRGAIPITVRSIANYPAHVLLQVASDRLKFPGGSTRLITLSRKNTTQRFKVQSIGSGAFPLRILLKSPDGRVVLGESRLTIRSTNASGVGIGLSLGALLFLMLWWIRHHRTRRVTDAADTA